MVHRVFRVQKAGLDTVADRRVGDRLELDLPSLARHQQRVIEVLESLGKPGEDDDETPMVESISDAQTLGELLDMAVEYEEQNAQEDGAEFDGGDVQVTSKMKKLASKFDAQAEKALEAWSKKHPDAFEKGMSAEDIIDNDGAFDTPWLLGIPTIKQTYGTGKYYIVKLQVRNPDGKVDSMTLSVYL